MTAFPSPMYLVCDEFPRYGFGALYDPTGDYDDAFDAFFKAVADGQSARVLSMTFDLETNAPETITEVTEEWIAAIGEMIAAE